MQIKCYITWPCACVRACVRYALVGVSEPGTLQYLGDCSVQDTCFNTCRSVVGFFVPVTVFLIGSEGRMNEAKKNFVPWAFLFFFFFSRLLATGRSGASC